MALTTASLRHAIGAILKGLEANHQKLNELDGQIGDGDLGITLVKAFRELDKVAPALPDDVGQALMQSASAVARVSSSSFGTLLATALMTTAKATRGRTEVPWSEVSGFIDAAVVAMATRGKSALGDKTVLDALDSAAKAGAGIDDPSALLAAARGGVDDALAAFRDRPNRIGRARIFGDKTVGMDDPGMIALRDMLDYLAG